MGYSERAQGLKRIPRMTNYDFCLAWNWEYDADFARILEQACEARRLRLLQVTPGNLLEILEALERGEVRFSAFLDRASEADIRFLPLVHCASGQAIYRLNPYDRAVHAMNKATMHLEFITAGIHTPYTIILPPYDKQADLQPLDLSPLGDRFTIKPAHGGGGEGVIIEATSLDQALQARLDYPADYYLLQAHIVPAQLGERPGWFRVIYCAGDIYPCWWDVKTHVYVPVSEEEQQTYGLLPLYSTTQVIAHVSRLDIFSTEIALTSAGLFVAVDYVNDQIDLRLKSAANDGVPDEIVRNIAGRLVELVANHILVQPV
jgi:hypothetical protein